MTGAERVEKVREYLKSNPEATAHQIAKAFNIQPNVAGNLRWRAAQKPAAHAAPLARTEPEAAGDTLERRFMAIAILIGLDRAQDLLASQRTEYARIGGVS